MSMTYEELPYKYRIACENLGLSEEQATYDYESSKNFRKILASGICSSMEASLRKGSVDNAKLQAAHEYLTFLRGEGVKVS